MEYKLLTKGPFENLKKFEKRINELAVRGWRVITTLSSGHVLVLGKERH